ncbi:glycosyltransferase family 4 protein [Flavobacterium hungaricum]|uniref:Glycosyltransferase family 4 protein n=1 Tax=Flavobacterium hungaricum TaxID=2082725 RepID=A0ABR9TE49_9FLAO|nr:glycosyltransferase family 4 protein [Flavobacterium hungaricum]MBE8723643.1 glycosyltransferase family 4 protein [Flavobacterium hungaricum]
MKLLYIVPKIKNAGGVARVIAVKANYFTQNFGYEVHILSQNEESKPAFYDFDSRISFHNMTLEGTIFHFFSSFKKSINQAIREINPDIILVADNGLKAFLVPFITNTKKPIVFECHGSKFVEEREVKTNMFSKIIRGTKYRFKDFSARRFTRVVALSNKNLSEWKISNGIVIPNPNWIGKAGKAAYKNTKVIAIARNSYEKGLDRLLVIWEKIHPKHPEWILNIYTDDTESLTEMIKDSKILFSINIHNFVSNIEEKYLESSLYAMTSRTEGFGMVLLEAMSLGIPCLAFDCPVGPRTLIKDNENGYLIPDGNFDLYVEKLSYLMNNEEERIRLGLAGNETAKLFSIEKIMKDWKMFFDELIEKN